MILPALMLAVQLAIVGDGLRSGGGVFRRISGLTGRASRQRRIIGSVLGNAAIYGVPGLLALLALGRLDAIGRIPDELRLVAWELGLPADADAAGLLWLLLMIAIGAALGLAVLELRRRLGRPPLGLPYRSPAAVQPGEGWFAPALLSLSAGIGEELFFRLTLPLLVLLVGGPAWLAIGGSLLAFTALHRHQGWAGAAASGLVGAALFALYLDTGQLWVAMLLHTLIDLNALILRPWLTRFSS